MYINFNQTVKFRVISDTVTVVLISSEPKELKAIAN